MTTTQPNATPSTLYVLIGVQGAGKTTWAGTHAADLGAIVVASDDIRNELEAAGLDATSRSDEVFATLEARVAGLLDQNQSVLVDATHARRHWRENVLNIARERGARRVALWFDLPLEALQRRNRRKPGGGWGDRVVPDGLLLEFWRHFEPPGADEFDEIRRVPLNELGVEEPTMADRDARAA